VSRTLLVPLFAGTLLVSAFLVFVVQPIMGKALLPLLGGSPAVWTTSLLFFQTALLAGYLYAHLGVRLLGRRRHAVVHLGLLALSLLALPIAIPAGWSPPVDTNPAAPVLAVLALAVGIPFALAASTAPLVQSWFAASAHRDRDNPYFLYAASNVGSLAALLAYPFVVEPLIGVTRQQDLWGWLYLAWIALVAACAIVLLRSTSSQAGSPTTPPPASSAAAPSPEAEAGPLRWIVLALVPSSLLLGVTAHISTDLASAPLLWVVPLALYLLTFVIAFARRRPLSHATALRWHLLLLIPLVVIWYWGIRVPLATGLVLHLGVFVLSALVCHGELYRTRPHAERLTTFYLAIALGGALGGAFNALIAPVLFRTVTEYPLALLAVVLLRPGPSRATPHDATPADTVRSLALPLAIGAGALVLTLWARPLLSGVPGRVLLFAALFGIGLAALRLARRPAHLTLTLALVLLAGWAGDRARTQVVAAERSFFGVHRVTLSQDGRFHLLFHGTTLHGAQALDPAEALSPITYYREEGPLGSAVRLITPPSGAPPRHVGVLGLGTGTAACLGSPDESWVFFEIDPVVARIATDPELFTYLRDCPPESTVHLGDARLSLERWEGTPFDLLIGDAFTSDAVPAHLLTVEALHLYMERLAPGGALVLHISNRHLHLEPVIAAAVEALGLIALTAIETLPPEAVTEEMATGAQWVTISRDPEPLLALLADDRWRPLFGDPEVGPWTDDHSDLLRVLRWFEPT